MDRFRKAVAVIGLSASLVLVPGAAFAETTVQNQNNSENSHASSGDANASNETTVESGPQANSAAGNSQAQQNGDNSTHVEEEAHAESGDAVAGSQVTGVSGSDGGKTTVMNANNSKNAGAFSGNANASNKTTVKSGPQANSIFGDANAQQNGSNATSVFETATAQSGDAISGSQVTGVI